MKNSIRNNASMEKLRKYEILNRETPFNSVELRGKIENNRKNEDKGG